MSDNRDAPCNGASTNDYPLTYNRKLIEVYTRHIAVLYCNGTGVINPHRPQLTQLPLVGYGTDDQFVRIIHRTWKSYEVPIQWTVGASSCKSANRNWIYCHWTDDDLESFIEAQYPGFASLYHRYRYPISRVDVARYFLLYHYAGIYLDLDISCIVPFDQIVTSVANVTSPNHRIESDVILAEAAPFGVVGDFIGVRRRRSSFMRHVVVGLPAAADVWYPLPYLTVMCGTGPIYLTRKLRKFQSLYATRTRRNSGGDVHVSIVPKHWYEHVFFKHLRGATWHSWDGRLLWNIYSHRRRYLTMAALVAAMSLAGLVIAMRRLRRGQRPSRGHSRTV